MSVRKTQLDSNLGDENAPRGSAPWIYWVLGTIRSTVSKLEGSASLVRTSLLALQETEAWKQLGYLSLEILAQREAKLTPDVTRRFLAAKKDETVKAVLADVAAEASFSPLAKQEHGIEGGKPGPGRGKKTVAKGHRLPTNKKSSNSRERILRRLARDYPGILEDVKAGKYRSARAAGIAAGIVKVPTPLQVALKAYNKLSDSDKAAFLRLIGARNEMVPAL